jgi:hypothetical protein
MCSGGIPPAARRVENVGSRVHGRLLPECELTLAFNGQQASALRMADFCFARMQTGAALMRSRVQISAGTVALALRRRMGFASGV